jgi:hypothetical protein
MRNQDDGGHPGQGSRAWCLSSEEASGASANCVGLPAGHARGNHAMGMRGHPTTRLLLPVAFLGWLGVVGLWIATGWWVVAAHPLTGPVLLVVTETNGLHVGDVPAIAFSGAASMWLWRTTTSCRP